MINLLFVACPPIFSPSSITPHLHFHIISSSKNLLSYNSTSSIKCRENPFIFPNIPIYHACTQIDLSLTLSHHVSRSKRLVVSSLTGWLNGGAGREDGNIFYYQFDEAASGVLYCWGEQLISCHVGLAKGD